MANARDWKRQVLVQVLIGTILNVAALGDEFNGGTGDANDPYQIATAQQLISIGLDPNLLDKHFILVDDVNLAEHAFTKAVIPTFDGTFDGDGHPIVNLTIESAEPFFGLFGRLHERAEVRGLQLTDALIARLRHFPSHSYGALTGVNEGSISNCNISVSIRTTLDATGDFVGGLAGENLGTVRDCNVVVLAASTWHWRIGGLIGYNRGSVEGCRTDGDAIVDAGLIAWSTGGDIVDCHSTLAASRAGLVSDFGGKGRMVRCSATGNVAGGASGAHIGGLVGMQQSGCVIEDCFAEGSVSGWGPVGGLVGWSEGSVIDSHATGTVTGRVYVGGLIGSNYGDVLCSYATGSVPCDPYRSPSEMSGAIGGLIGANCGERVHRCYALGDVTGGGSVGGLIGTSQTRSSSSSPARLSESYAAGKVEAEVDVGSLVGSHKDGIISNSYSTATVSGRDYVGGLVGHDRSLRSWDPIWNCYAAGPVTADQDAQHVGGLVGYHLRMPDEDFGTASYFLRPEDGGGPNNGLGQPLSAAALKQQASFAGWDFVGTEEDGTDDVWFMPVASYPVLSQQASVHTVPDVNGLTFEDATATLTDAGFIVGAEPTEDYHRTLPVGTVITTDPYEYAPVGGAVQIIVSGGPCDWNDVPGHGTPSDPYLATAGILEALSDNYRTQDAHVKLTDDIDMSGRQYDDAVIDYDAAGFHGTLEGDNHRIRHLNASLFDTIEGEVRNLRIEDADIEEGCPHVGILACENQGTIRNCRVTGRVSVSQYSCSGYTEPSTGGLVGTNWGTIAECHADVEVTGQKSVGGLVGDNLGTIADSHAEGSVTGHRYGQYVGGLVGSNRLGSQGRRGRGDILRCWATSDVTSGDDSRWVGGLVGHNTGLVSLSYARGTVRGGDSTASYYQSFSPGTGGLVGFNAGDVTYCYATGAVSGYDNVGGLVGYNSDEVYAWATEMTAGAIRDCYATGKVTSWMLSEPVTDIPEAPHVGGLIGGDYGQLRNGYFLDPNDAGGFDSGWGTALRDTQMRTQASFAGWDFVGETTDGTEDIWTICEGVDYPRLWWEDRGCPGR